MIGPPTRTVTDAFSDALFGARFASKLRQEDVATVVGVSRTSIVMYEQGKATPSLAVALRLRRALPTLDLNALADEL